MRFRLDDLRFECTCDRRTLRIIDAGVCLVDHHTGERGDDYFTLESLPGVIRQAEEEGVADVLKAAGFDWREPGCSMCLAMNADKLAPGERCASTSNRNFEGRQGKGGRTHLMSPGMAAAAALTGRLADVREV